MDICFCCSDSPTKDIVRLLCFKKMIHQQCLLACLRMNSQCPYCHHILDIVILLEYVIIERSVPTHTSTSPMKTPIKCTLQDMLMNVDAKTPLREADRVCSESKERKCLCQIKQANKMICTQGKLMQKLGASPGAVVVVKVD